MTRTLLAFAAGIAVGAVLLAVGFLIGAATAAEPSRSAPVTLRPLPVLESQTRVSGYPAAVPSRLPPEEVTDADQGDPSPVTTASPEPLPTEPSETADAPSPVIRGIASWYSVGSGHAAAGPLLRVGDWRGREVRVCAGELCVVTSLTDWCACGDRPGGPTVIDLSKSDFARLAPPSRGLVEVSVTWN